MSGNLQRGSRYNDSVNTQDSFVLNTIEEAIEDIRKGKIIFDLWCYKGYNPMKDNVLR